MRKAILLILAFILILPSISVLAESDSFEEAVRKANEEIGYDYYDISKVNKETYDNYGVLVYGSPSGDTDSKGEPRYLGSMPDGTEYTNYKRMHDEFVGGTLDKRSWIAEPWDNPIAQKLGASINDFNGSSEYNDAMIAGMKYAYGNDVIDGSMGDWTKYAQILQPPTGKTWGMARMWHTTAAGKTWYITFPIMPTDPDDDDGDKSSPVVIDPPKIIASPRSPQVAVKWDIVPLKILATSPITGKIRRDTSFTWTEYEFEVEQKFNGVSKGSARLKAVYFSQDKFFQPRSASKDWYTESPKPTYTVPGNGKPGTVLIAKLKAKIRYDEAFPGLPPMPKKPQPEVPMPSYPRPSYPYYPSEPDEDASDSEWSLYFSDLDVYDEERAYYDANIGPWNEYDAYISSPEYQRYLLEMADYSRLVSVRGQYHTLEDRDPSIIPVSGYNFAEYAVYHSALMYFEL